MAHPHPKLHVLSHTAEVQQSRPETSATIARSGQPFPVHLRLRSLPTMKSGSECLSRRDKNGGIRATFSGFERRSPSPLPDPSVLAKSLLVERLIMDTREASLQPRFDETIRESGKGESDRLVDPFAAAILPHLVPGMVISESNVRDRDKCQGSDSGRSVKKFPGQQNLSTRVMPLVAESSPDPQRSYSTSSSLILEDDSVSTCYTGASQGDSLRYASGSNPHPADVLAVVSPGRPARSDPQEYNSELGDSTLGHEEGPRCGNRHIGLEEELGTIHCATVRPVSRSSERMLLELNTQRVCQQWDQAPGLAAAGTPCWTASVASRASITSQGFQNVLQTGSE